MKVRIDFKFKNNDTNKIYDANTITLLDVKNKKELLKKAKELLFQEYGIKVTRGTPIYIDNKTFKPRKLGFYKQFKEQYDDTEKLFNAEVWVTFEELKPIYF